MQKSSIKNQSVVRGQSSVVTTTDHGQWTRNNFLFFVYAVLIVVTLAVFWPVRHFEFINYDDQEYVTHNSFVQKGLAKESLAWAFLAKHASNWHPLTWRSQLLDS